MVNSYILFDCQGYKLEKFTSFPMPFSLVAALVIVFLTVAFSLQNVRSVAIKFLEWNFEGSLVLVLLTTLFLGMLIHLLASMPVRMRKTRQIVQLNTRIAELEHCLSEKVQPPR